MKTILTNDNFPNLLDIIVIIAFIIVMYFAIKEIRKSPYHDQRDKYFDTIEENEKKDILI